MATGPLLLYRPGDEDAGRLQTLLITMLPPLYTSNNPCKDLASVYAKAAAEFTCEEKVMCIKMC